MRRRAFTLIELLVVIVIIAILMVILMPVFVTARQLALRTAAMGQMSQLSRAAMLYSNDHDSKFVPATNWGVPESQPERIWTAMLFHYAGDNEAVFVAKGTDAQYPKDWANRGYGSIGMNTGTAIDQVDGCVEGQKDTTGCWGFDGPATIEKTDNPAMVPIFAVTPHGPTEDGYRGYEFSPYNGLPRPVNYNESPPLIADRDLVAELLILPPDLIKPIFARYGADGEGNGFTPVVFGDGHASSYRARVIQTGQTKILWRFR